MSNQKGTSKARIRRYVERFRNFYDWQRPQADGRSGVWSTEPTPLCLENAGNTIRHLLRLGCFENDAAHLVAKWESGGGKGLWKELIANLRTRANLPLSFDLLASFDEDRILVANALENEQSGDSNIAGMSWKEAKKNAERIVKKSGWPGLEKLRTAVGGCHKKTLRKAIDNSNLLQKAEAAHKASKKRPTAVSLSKKVVTTQGQESEGPKLSAAEVDEVLSELRQQIKKDHPSEIEQFDLQLADMNAEGRRVLAEQYENGDYDEAKKAARHHKTV